MPKLTSPSHSQHPQRQRGISLIESLVALVVAALGILGIVGVQMRTLADTQTGVRRAQAILLIEDIGERMKLNPNALANINAYETAFDAEPTVPDCSGGCDPAALAAYDVANWKKTVKENLPLGQASIFIPPAEAELAAGMGRQLGVMLAWRENERAIPDETDAKIFKNNLDTTKILVDGEWKAGAGDTVCPDNHTCHLQYIPVSARCAPYDNGSDTPLFYCS